MWEQPGGHFGFYGQAMDDASTVRKWHILLERREEALAAAQAARARSWAVRAESIAIRQLVAETRAGRSDIAVGGLDRAAARTASAGGVGEVPDALASGRAST